MEYVRRVIRSWLGWDSWLYRRASALIAESSILFKEGIGTAIQLRKIASMKTGNGTIPVNFSSLNFPFHIRPGTKDISVAINNFVREEYGVIQLDEEPKVLVDGGAYIGDTSAYFLSKYSSLCVIALEPMQDSLELARLNLKPYGSRVDLRASALTVDGLPVKMSGIQTGARIGDLGEIEVASTTIQQILFELPNNRIDILKLDIEGAEGPIFDSNPDQWLDNIGLIIVETHGPESEKSVLTALESNGWDVRRFRNLFYCKKQ